MTVNRRRGNTMLACLVAAAVVVALIILFLPSGEAAAEQSGENLTEESAEDLDSAVEKATLAKEGMAAPDFTVEMVDGSRLTLSALKGKVVLVNFWATWCPPCREELKHVQSGIVDRFAGKPFQMIAISRGEKRETVEKFLADNGYRFPAGIDPEEKIYHLFASNYIPRNFLIDADGKVVFAGVGYDEEEFAKLTEKIDETLKNL